MPKEQLRILVREEVARIKPDINNQIFQFDLDRDQAKQFLLRNPSVPFVIRDSNTEGYCAFSYLHKGKAYHLLIEPSSDNSPFKIIERRSGVTKEVTTLNSLIQKYCARKVPPTKKVAVFSVQTLDQEKVALTAEQVEQYALIRSSLRGRGDGHSGFAMAKALRAPFVVVRSTGNRDDNNLVLKDRIGNGGLLVITGHGSEGGSEINGIYGVISNSNRNRREIERDPTDIVNSAIESGLKRGDRISILLSICYGALDPTEDGNSFAQKLARAFAARGISTVIVASDKPVLRFGHEIINNGRIQFNSSTGMAAQDVCIFTTNVARPLLSPLIEISKPNADIELSREGLRLVGRDGPRLLAPQDASPSSEDEKKSQRKLKPNMPQYNEEFLRQQREARHAQRLSRSETEENTKQPESDQDNPYPRA
jgi:hypothetical protein